LLEAVIRLAASIEQPFKHHLAFPRPVQFAHEVQPLIHTPTHGSWPSGHATEAYAVAQVFKAILPVDPNQTPNQISRLAERIAANRIVAGVHFPTDNYAGALLGKSIGDYLVNLLSNGTTTTSVVYEPKKANSVGQDLGTPFRDTFVTATSEKDLTPSNSGLIFDLLEEAKKEYTYS